MSFVCGRVSEEDIGSWEGNDDGYWVIVFEWR